MKGFSLSDSGYVSSCVETGLKVLKAGEVKIAAGCSDDEIAGVVQSSKKSDTGYACRLTHDGSFSCCTRNLRPCGGLKGRICKHIVLLLFGLTEAGQLRPKDIASWITASQSKKPELDKDLMKAVFAKKKVLGTADITWHAVKTKPADYKKFWLR